MVGENTGGGRECALSGAAAAPCPGPGPGPEPLPAASSSVSSAPHPASWADPGAEASDLRKRGDRRTGQVRKSEDLEQDLGEAQDPEKPVRLIRTLVKKQRILLRSCASSTLKPLQGHHCFTFSISIPICPINSLLTLLGCSHLTHREASSWASSQPWNSSACVLCNRQ